ncbi:hypothetical protein Tco_1255077 [Tanacetum coccineum]
MMNKGFLNRSSTASKAGDNDLSGKGALLGDLASKIRNIDGKILGRDGKPMVARRCVRFADKTKESVSGDARKGKGKQVILTYSKRYRVNIPKSKLVYRAVVKPQGAYNVASNMEQSLDTTKKPSPVDSSKNGDKVSSKKSSSSMEIFNEDSDTDEDEVFLPNDGNSFPSSSGGGGQTLEEDMLNAYDDYEDQFEEYPSSYQEFCDQFDFKVKGLGRK